MNLFQSSVSFLCTKQSNSVLVVFLQLHTITAFVTSVVFQLNLKMKEPKTRKSEFTSEVISCRCGQGRNRNKSYYNNITSCDSFGKRCKCFQALRGCGGNCQCLNCETPRGKRDVASRSTTTHSASATRKRQRMNFQNVLQQSRKEQGADFTKLDCKVMVISIINFFIWNGIPLDSDLVVAVIGKIVVSTDKQNMTRQEICGLVDNVIKLFSAHAAVLDAKLWDDLINILIFWLCRVSFMHYFKTHILLWKNDRKSPIRPHPGTSVNILKAEQTWIR